MKKYIRLDDYKDKRIYLKVFEVLIKKEDSIDEFFYGHYNIAPSSFRKGLKKDIREETINNLLNLLCDYFKYKVPTNIIIDELEEFINKVYNNIYYQIECDFEKDLEYIDNLIKERYLIFPILNLIKILISITNIKIKEVLKEREKDFKELKKFINYFNDDLMMVFEFIEISFIEEIDEFILTNEYKNDISYFTLSGKCYLLGKYSNSIDLALKARNRFFSTMNLKRIIRINLTLLANYNVLKKYEKALELADQQVSFLESIGFSVDLDEFRETLIEYSIACIGLGKIEEAYGVVSKIKRLNLNCITILLICCFKLNIDCNVINITEMSSSRQNVVGKINNLLQRYLTKKNKEDAKELNELNIAKTIKLLIVNL